MADNPTALRSITKAGDFLTCAADGFTTTIMSQPPDVDIQLNFWNVDGTPEAENRICLMATETGTRSTVEPYYVQRSG